MHYPSSVGHLLQWTGALQSSTHTRETRRDAVVFEVDNGIAGFL
jgi:hypothetical protein